MTLGACSREKELSELLKQGHWPQACAEELRAHVASCRACREMVLVTTTFQAARTEAASAAQLQSPGLLWWRAQLRRRNADLERIAKPLLGAQIFALAVALLGGAGFVAFQAQRGFSWIAWLQELPRSLHLESLLPAALPRLDGGFWLLVPVLATLALLGGVAVYMASEKQ
jgi:hypothetical protein